MAFDSDKISDESLREIAGSASAKVCSVIVEMNLPARQIAFERATAGNAGIALPTAVVKESADEIRARKEKERALSRLLTSVLGKPPRHIAAARAFVVEANGAQLAEIAGSDLVRAISPNRKLR